MMNQEQAEALAQRIFDGVFGESRRPTEVVRFHQSDAALAVQKVYGAFVTPHNLQPGQLVQGRTFFGGWDGHEPGKKAPLMVLDTTEDLASRTGNIAHTGMFGIRVARADPDESVSFSWVEGAFYEPYTGPLAAAAPQGGF